MKIIALNASGKGQAADFMHSIGNYALQKELLIAMLLVQTQIESIMIFDSSLFSDPFFIQSII